MRPIGIVASDTSEIEVNIITLDGMQHEVSIEDMVEIVDSINKKRYLGIIRSGEGLNENLKTQTYRPSIGYVVKGFSPSDSREVFTYRCSIIGIRNEDGSIEPNRILISPRSVVYKLEDDENPMRIDGMIYGDLRYSMRVEWQVPINAEFIPYHIGIFGSTGSGKSMLTRYIIIPTLLQAGYNVIVLDWKGTDYAPFFENVIKFGDILLDDDTVISYLIRSLKYFGVKGYQQRNKGYEALESVILQGDWRKYANDPEELKSYLIERVKKEIEREESTKQGLSKYGEKWLIRVDRYFDQLEDRSLKNIIGSMRPDEIVDMARESRVLVIDMSIGNKDEKLSVFLSLANYIKARMEEGEELGLALVIDESPQYAPFNPSGLEKEATEMIKSLAALGRGYKLSLVLIAQGIAGEIGLNAAVRRNLNTMFFGRLHPLDVNEAGNWLKPYGIDPKKLLTLKPGQFYFHGLMNPFIMPMLTTFFIEKEGADEEPNEEGGSDEEAKGMTLDNFFNG